MKEEIKELKYYIETWGCQMNEEDSEKLSGMLKSVGYTKTESIEEAGIIIYNTCCVRENAENKVFGNLGELKHLKKKNPDLIIAVCGCMMQQEGMADKILTDNYLFFLMCFIRRLRLRIWVGVRVLRLFAYGFSPSLN